MVGTDRSIKFRYVDSSMDMYYSSSYVAPYLTSKISTIITVYSPADSGTDVIFLEVIAAPT